MKCLAIFSLCMMHCLDVFGQTSSIVIQNDTLVRWSLDYKGMAVVPSGVHHIGVQAFSHCKSLTGVVLPATLETIGPLAFSGCARLKEVVIPESVTNIGGSAFCNCKSMTNLVVLAKTKKLPEDMCSRCFGLRNIGLPDGVVEIGDRAFICCRSIDCIRIPESVRRIGRASFAGCSRLRTLFLPEGLECIDQFAFVCCYDMKYIVLSSKIESVGADAFKGCVSLTGIIVTNDAGFCTVIPANRCQDVSVPDVLKRYSRDDSRSRHVLLDDAFSFCEASAVKRASNDIFDGLAQVLRIAADGIVSDLPDAHTVMRLDSFAGNLFKLGATNNILDIKKYFNDHSSFVIDVGDKLIAYISTENDMAITVEYKDGQMTMLTLSDGLKAVIRKHINIEDDKQDESVLRWLR